jgi:hypothetical protein
MHPPKTVVVGDFNTPLLSRQKKKTTKKLLLSDTIDQMDLSDNYKVFPLATVQYTFFLAAHGTVSKIDQ